MERDPLPQGYRATFRKKLTLTLFRMGFFGAAHGWQTSATMIKLGTVIPCLRKIQKMYKPRDTSLEFC